MTQIAFDSSVLAVNGLSELAGRYDVLFCDIWGVVHNGIRAYRDAVDALRQYRRGGGVVALITNAPRPSGPIVAMLDGMGVERDAYDVLVSSGDATRTLIGDYRGRVIHHVGPPTEDDAIYEGLDVIRGSAEDAEVVVVTDLDDDNETPDDYMERMALWKGRNLPLICANPDRFVEVGDRLIYCGGALADAYAEIGGEAIMAGKPFPPIYAETLRQAEARAGRKLDRSRILAVGDSVRTDAKGAAEQGFDLLFITGSIHAAELDAFGAPDPAAVEALVAPTGVRLAGFMPRLAW